MKRLDLVTNIVVIVTSLVLLSFLGHLWLADQRKPLSNVTQVKNLVGNSIQLKGVDFQQRDKTLLIAISDTCHFCKESQPFYRLLAETSSSKGNLVAVLSMPQLDADKYVHTWISPSIQSVSAPLDVLGVHSTPTLLLVDRSGKVRNAWVGKLDDAQQKQVQSLF